MSLAEETRPPAFATEDDVNANVRDVARELVRVFGDDRPALARALGVTGATLAGKLSGHRRFTTAELYMMAQHFGVSTEAFFRPAGELRAELRARVQNWKVAKVIDSSGVRGPVRGVPSEREPELPFPPASPRRLRVVSEPERVVERRLPLGSGARLAPAGPVR